MLGATLAFAMARIRLARGASRDKSTIPPGATVETGAISAEEYGGKGKEIILIPGLGGGAWSWTNMLRRFSPDHRIYALTLAEFDGRAPVAAPMIDKVVADIARFIEARRVDRPILIGHSLGAFIALRLGVEHAKLIGGLVTLDGYPVFPPLAEMNLEDRRAAASRLSQQFKVGRDVKKFREVMREFLAARMNDPTLAANIAERAARSDPDATARYVVEMLSADIRPALDRLEAPLLALVAVNSYKNGLSEPEIVRFYSGLFAKAPRVAMMLVRDARHFLAEDQPEVVGAAIEGFLAGLQLTRR